MRVDANQRELVVDYKEQTVKRLGIKGLYGRVLSLEGYKVAITAEAKSEQRGWQGLSK